MNLRMMAILAVTATTLAGCGLRGDLETPPPIWGDKDAEIAEAKPAEPTRTVVVQRPQTLGSYVDPTTGRTVWKRNVRGGEVPMASPQESFSEGALAPPSS